MGRWKAAEHSWWAKGAFHVVSDTECRIYPPQGIDPGTYALRTYNGLSLSNAINIKVVRNQTPILRTNSILEPGQTQSFKVTKGNLNTTVARQFIIASLLRSPSRLLPIYDFEIGNNFTQMILFPNLPFDGNGVSSLDVPVVPSATGLTIYFEAGYIDGINPVWPMPSSDVWSTRYL